MPTRSVSAAVALALGAALASAPASADPVADFYKDRNFTIVVGFTAGGGADTFARFLARHLGDYIPGKPNVIVQNMPGAGGLKSLNYIYNAEPQDGSRAILTSPSHTLAQVLGTPNIRYDMTKMHWLGTLTRDTAGCLASGRSGIKSITDATEREIIVGATGPNDTIAQHSRLLTGLLGYRLRVIPGYQGVTQVRLAMETGEVEMVCSFWASQLLGSQRDDIESGRLVPIAQMGSKPHPAFRGAPVAYDLAKSDADRQVMRAIFGTTELSWPFLMPPGAPADRVGALREAFWAAVNSPELKADAARARLIVDPMDWKESEEAFREIVEVPKEAIERARKLISD